MSPVKIRSYWKPERFGKLPFSWRPVWEIPLWKQHFNRARTVGDLGDAVVGRGEGLGSNAGQRGGSR